MASAPQNVFLRYDILVTWGFQNARIHGYMDIRLPGDMDTWLHRYMDNEYVDSGIQRFRDAWKLEYMKA